MISPKDIIESGLCIGCGICVAQSGRGKKVQMDFDSYGQLKPSGPSEWLEQTSESLTKTCPFSPYAADENELSDDLFANIHQKKASIGRYITNWIGHVAEDDYRNQGSSGGMTTWIAAELMRKGLVDGVGHVISTDPHLSKGKFFQYRISRSEKEIREGAKSRYYPVELSEILKIVKEVPGRYAIVAVPCMIKALQLLRRQNDLYRERIQYTLALFCGHMKSTRFVESFAWQMKVPFEEMMGVDFRYKIPDRPANWYCASLQMKDRREAKKDWWHLADGDWGAGFFMNSACNFCDDVVGETADISFGDAWIEPWISDGRGTNIVIVRSALIQETILEGIKEGSLSLEEVTDEIVEETQAAALRQRREGLAYRLLWATRKIKPRKRVRSDGLKLEKSRRLVYWMRFMISKWSHRVFWLAKKAKKPEIYLSWARTIASIYYGITYKQGDLNQISKRYKDLKDK